MVYLLLCLWRSERCARARLLAKKLGITMLEHNGDNKNSSSSRRRSSGEEGTTASPTNLPLNLWDCDRFTLVAATVAVVPEPKKTQSIHHVCGTHSCTLALSFSSLPPQQHTLVVRSFSKTSLENVSTIIYGKIHTLLHRFCAPFVVVVVADCYCWKRLKRYAITRLICDFPYMEVKL